MIAGKVLAGDVVVLLLPVTRQGARIGRVELAVGTLERTFSGAEEEGEGGGRERQKTEDALCPHVGLHVGALDVLVGATLERTAMHPGGDGMR
jgi:hypothetical protein